MTRLLRTTLATLVLACATLAPAIAEPTIGGGVSSTNGKTTFGGLVSDSLVNLPLLPLHVDATVESPFTNGGYAATLEARFTPFGNEIGAGAGFGTAGTAGTNAAFGDPGILYSAFIGHRVFPRTTLELREYFGHDRASSFFGGLRFSL